MQLQTHIHLKTHTKHAKNMIWNVSLSKRMPGPDFNKGVHLGHGVKHKVVDSRLFAGEDAFVHLEVRGAGNGCLEGDFVTVPGKAMARALH